jgi:hypothetical protein
MSAEAEPPATLSTERPARDFRIDLARGLSLWLIYLDHIPNNVLSRLTPRNFGFSDAAEIFIFISGFTCGLVYGKLARHDGLTAATAHAWRRTWQIYVAAIVLFVIYAAEVSLAAAGRGELLDETNLAAFLRDPGTALLQLLTLRYAPVNMDALPLIIVMHLVLPAMLVGLLHAPRTMLAGSAALYALAHHFDWSIAAYPNGTVYFNPLDWQLLFAIGAWCGFGQITSIAGALRAPATAIACLALLALSLVVVIGWQWPALQFPLPDTVAAMIYPIDKSNLDLLRLLHFLALAILVWRFIPSNFAMLQTRWLLPIIRCGEYSLVLFCLGVLLAFAAHVILLDLSGGLIMQILVGLGGIGVMIGTATLLAKADRTSNEHPRTI